MNPLDDTDAPVLDAVAELTPAKQAAVEALATGSSQTEAAVLAGVSREAVNRWFNHDPTFRDALAEYRAVLVTEQADRARRIRGRALSVVESRLDDDASLTDALAVVRVLSPPAESRSDLDAIPAGSRIMPTGPEVWATLQEFRDADAARQRDDREQMRRELTADLADRPTPVATT
ncbi:MAG: hypothetical protein ACLPR9_20210 [Acidimicrobiales bacterium]